jgi:hypothetical protein
MLVWSLLACGALCGQAPTHGQTDEMWLVDGPRLEGTVLSGAVSNRIALRVPWNESSLAVEKRRIAALDLAPARDALRPDAFVTLTNGWVLPCRLVELAKDHLILDDGAELRRKIPFRDVATLRLGAPEIVFSSAISGWQFEKWQGTTNLWEVRHGGLAYVGGSELRDRGLRYSLPPTGDFAATIRFAMLDSGRLLLSQHKTEPDSNVAVVFERTDDVPNCLQLELKLLEPNAQGDSPEVIIPDHDLDFRIERRRDMLHLFLEGVELARTPLPADHIPIIGLATELVLHVKEVTVLSGTTGFPSPYKKQEASFGLYFANGDSVSTETILPVGKELQFSIHGATARIPLEKVQFIRFPGANHDAPQETGDEITCRGVTLATGELTAITERDVTFRDGGGRIHAFPRTFPVTILPATADRRYRSPRQLVQTLSEAILSNDLPGVRGCFIGGGQDFSAGVDALRQNGQKLVRFELQLQPPSAAGQTVMRQVHLVLGIRDRDGEVDETQKDQPIEIIRHQGRWYLYARDWW